MSDLNGPNKNRSGSFKCGKNHLYINVDKSQFDMTTYLGRARHYLRLYGPHHFFTSEAKLQNARTLLRKYRNGEKVGDVSLTQLWKAKYLYESTYDVHTDEKAFIMGRPSAFVPMSALVGSAMLTYYTHNSHLIFWQVMYQTFQQSVNFVERPPTSVVEDLCLLKGYAAGLMAATSIVIVWKKLSKNTSSMTQRMGPVSGAIIGTVVSIPVSRYMELQKGIPIFDELDRKLGYSTRATYVSIAVDIVRQVFVTAPTFDSTVVLSTFFARYSKRRGWITKTRHYFPTQMLYIAFFCTIVTPFLRALVPEKGYLPFAYLHPKLQEDVKKNIGLTPERVYFWSGASMNDVTVDQLWRAKYLYDSAYHPDTGELMPRVGRMSMQLPMNTTISAAMFTFRTSPPAVIFWQWFNQSFNATVNYTNRSGKNPIPKQTLIASYVFATTGAVGTALGINNLVKTMPPIVGRFVPFIAIVAANLINIPIMRNRELIEGVEIMDENNNTLGRSRRAARRGISLVVFSRVMMVLPTMAIMPFVLDAAEKRGLLRKYPWSEMPIQTALLAVILVFAVPMCCAIFPQKMSIRVSKLEPELQTSIMRMKNPPNYVAYNKGL